MACKDGKGKVGMRFRAISNVSLFSKLLVFNGKWTNPNSQTSLTFWDTTHTCWKVFTVFVVAGVGKICCCPREWELNLFQGIFVQFVREGSPAALAGLRFGDQILQINGQNVLGLSHDKAMDLMTKSKDPGKILLAVRDRFVSSFLEPCAFWTWKYFWLNKNYFMLNNVPFCETMLIIKLLILFQIGDMSWRNCWGPVT